MVPHRVGTKLRGDLGIFENYFSVLFPFFSLFVVIISVPLVPAVRMAAHLSSCTAQSHYVEKAVSELILCNYNDSNILYHDAFYMREAVLCHPVFYFL